MKFNYIYLIILSVLITGKVTGQIVSQDFYSYRLNNMYSLNAAYSGKDEGLNFILSAKSQNKGVNFSNKNFMGGAYGKISNNQALGGKLLIDSRGAFQILNTELTYSYSLKLNSESNLHFGVNAGIIKTDLVASRIENYNMVDQTDETLYLPYFNSFQFTSGVGALYTFKGLEVGVSLPAILTTNADKPTSLINANAGYKIETKGKFDIEPWVMYQNTPYLKNLGSLFVKTTYNDLVWIQGGYQTNQSILASVGFQLDNFSIGYGFTFNNKTYSIVSKGTNEVTIRYNLVKNKAVTSNGTKSSLDNILDKLDKLSATDVNENNRAKLLKQLNEIKTSLVELEVDSDNPENARKIRKQLEQINEKLNLVEEKLNK